MFITQNKIAYLEQGARPHRYQPPSRSSSPDTDAHDSKPLSLKADCPPD